MIHILEFLQNPPPPPPRMLDNGSSVGSLDPVAYLAPRLARANLALRGEFVETLRGDLRDVGHTKASLKTARDVFEASWPWGTPLGGQAGRALLSSQHFPRIEEEFEPFDPEIPF